MYNNNYVNVSSDSVSYLTDESISGMEKAIKVNECLEDTMYFI